MHTHHHLLQNLPFPSLDMANHLDVGMVLDEGLHKQGVLEEAVDQDSHSNEDVGVGLEMDVHAMQVPIIFRIICGMPSRIGQIIPTGRIWLLSVRFSIEVTIWEIPSACRLSRTGGCSQFVIAHFCIAHRLLALSMSMQR